MQSIPAHCRAAFVPHAAFALAVSLLGSTALLPAQTVVDPGGGGHYRALQAAIAAVPPGTVLKVIGGTYGPLHRDVFEPMRRSFDLVREITGAIQHEVGAFG